MDYGKSPYKFSLKKRILEWNEPKILFKVTDDLKVDHLECVDRRVIDLRCADESHLTHTYERI